MPQSSRNADRLQGLAWPKLYIAVWKTSVHMPFWTQELAAASLEIKHSTASSSRCQNASDPKFVKRIVQ